jgi:hypothetical protein
MGKLNFMTMGDDNFFHTIKYSVGQVARLYPEAHFFVYDWGFTEPQVSDLAGDKVTIVPWVKKAHHLPFKTYVGVFRPLVFRKTRWLIRSGFRRLQRNLFIFTQKPFCIQDCLRRSSGDLVFLDGDAFIVDRIDEVLGQDFNVGVTLRRQHEIVFPAKNGVCSALNVGVMFFKGSMSVLEAFIERWNTEIEVTRDYCMEQTALSNIVARIRKDIYDGYNKTGVLETRGERVKIKVLPCEEYNFNWIEEGFDRQKNKILHFKGGRHSREAFEELREKIKLDETLNDKEPSNTSM